MKQEKYYNKIKNKEKVLLILGLLSMKENQIKTYRCLEKDNLL